MRGRKGIKAALCAAALAVGLLLGGCGEEAPRLEGSCREILSTVYETAELDADTRQTLQGYEMSELDESMKGYLLGTEDIAYTDAVCSVPQINVVAYQCIVLRVDGDDAAAETARQTLLSCADPRKWICVEAESVVVERVGDVVLFVMGDAATTDALKAAFLAMGEA